MKANCIGLVGIEKWNWCIMHYPYAWRFCITLIISIKGKGWGGSVECATINTINECASVWRLFTYYGYAVNRDGANSVDDKTQTIMFYLIMHWLMWVGWFVVVVLCVFLGGGGGRHCCVYVWVVWGWWGICVCVCVHACVYVCMCMCFCLHLLCKDGDDTLVHCF